MLSSLTPIPFAGKHGGAHRPAFSAAPSVVPAQFPDEPGFAILFARAPYPMWIFDAGTLQFLAVNDAAIQRYEWTREEFLSLTADKVRPATDVAEFLDFHRSHAGRGESGINETKNCRHITRSGKILAVRTACQRIRFHKREAFLVTIMDRSEQQRTEDENREFASILNLASDAIIVCDLNREILFWNKGAEKIYGWTASEALGKTAHKLLGIDSEVVLTCMNGLLAKGDWSGEMQHARKDGNKATVNSRWTLARNSKTGEPESVLLISSDITENKKLESQFLRTQRLESIGTLASGIAHDLNNILSPILMATGILRGSSSISEEDKKMLSIIDGSAERGASIVKQVLTFARGAEGEHALLQPEHLVTEMTKVIHQTFPKNIDIKTSLPSDLWMVSGDATQLHQILLNLCVNARDAIGEGGGIIRMAAENVQVDEHLARTNPGAQLGAHVCISVTDSGTGMPPEVMEKIFDPFFTTKEQGKGTGLGLATVIGIVKGHKGFITIQSQVGVGTTFRVFLPADTEAKGEEVKAASTGQLRGNGELVLVVDDEAPVREAVVATLEANGYRCFTAEDGTDALALYFERREIDIVITDLHMGMMDGIALTRSLKRLNPDVRVIVSSGHVDKDKQAIIEGLGVKLILEKPYTAEKLLRSVKGILTNKA